jgi:hypothetical protein
LVEYLLDLNEHEKEYTPIIVTQAIMNIYKAWRTVTEYVKMLEKFRVDYIEQNFEHLDLDFEKYLDCDSNAQTNDEMLDEAIADFCLKKITEEVEEVMDNLIIENEKEKNIPTLAEAKLAYKVIFDRLSQSKDFSENDLEALTKIENSLNKNI